MSNKNRSLIVPALLAFLSLANSAYAGNFPSYVDYGRRPVWLSNEEIIFASGVSQTKPIHYGPLDELFNSFEYIDSPPPTYKVVRTDYYICSMKIDGTDEKIIKQSAIIYDENEKPVKEIMIENEGVATNSTDPRFSQLEEVGEPLSIVERGLWVMDADGGNKHKIVDGYNPYGCWSRWHPTENKVYYSPATTYGKRGEGTLWLIDSATSKKIKIDDAYQCDYKCHISPDSKKIVYTKENKDTVYFESLWIADADGTNKKRITGNVWGCGNWNPEGKVVFNLYDEMYTFYTYDVETDKIDSQVKLPKDMRIGPMGWFRGNKWFYDNYIYNANSKEKIPVKIAETGDLDISSGEHFWSPDYNKVIIKGRRRIRKEKKGENTPTEYNDWDDQGWYLIDENGVCKLLLRGG